MQKSVLIVEDEILIAVGLEFMLEEHGWQVIGPASNVEEALALLTRERPATALLDVNLGPELVTPVAMVLRELGVPFVLASACENPAQVGGAVLEGIENFGKPTAPDRLITTLEQLASAA